MEVDVHLAGIAPEAGIQVVTVTGLGIPQVPSRKEEGSVSETEPGAMGYCRADWK